VNISAAAWLCRTRKTGYEKGWGFKDTLDRAVVQLREESSQGIVRVSSVKHGRAEIKDG
jgi:hypothetical protein